MNWRTVARIIEKERPDALLPTMGGQTALNCALDLVREGVLEKFGVELIGASREAIDMAEDREQFRNAMREIGLECPRSRIAHSMEEALAIQAEIGFPTVIRPSFTLGGTGGGIAYNREEFEAIVTRGLDASPTSEVLLEESVLGWKEFEMEVVRDQNDNCIIICSIENLDPMGVHTGDSITVAPAQTLTDKEYQRMRDASIAVLRKIGVDTGGSNVQFAVNPTDGRLLVIEMNPRVSRSSALASKATGFPIAKIAAKLAVGYTLDELRNDITGGATPASFEPTIDYVVTKVPRFTFEKFPGANDRLTTQMKSVGEVMAIGRTFQESLQKALRGLETGLDGLTPVVQLPLGDEDMDALLEELRMPGPHRLLYVADALPRRLGAGARCTGSRIDPGSWRRSRTWCARRRVVAAQGAGARWTRRACATLKRKGFSDSRLAQLLRRDARRRCASGARRSACGPVYKRVDTCAAEFATSTAYLYSTYEEECEARAHRPAQDHDPRRRPEPHRPGHRVRLLLRACGARAARGRLRDHHGQLQPGDGVHRLRHLGSAVLRAADARGRDGDPAREKPEGVIVQFGGQTPLKLARRSGPPACPSSARARTPSTWPRTASASRSSWTGCSCGSRRTARRAPRNRRCGSPREVGFPLVVRPSYVLGGRAMEVVFTEDDLRTYMTHAVQVSNDSPVLLDRFLDLAIEVDVDAICDGTRRAASAASWSTSSRRACIRATPAARCRPTACARSCRRRSASRPAAGARAQRRRPDEHPVRDPERRRVRARGQSARLPHGAVRLQGHGRAAGQDRRPA